MGKLLRTVAVVGGGLIGTGALAVGVDQIHSGCTGERSKISEFLQEGGVYADVEEKLKIKYEKAREKWRAGKITEPELVALLRTYAIADRTPQGEIPINQEVKTGEKVTLFAAVAIPRGETAPISISWEHNDEAEDEHYREISSRPGYRFRIWDSRIFRRPGNYVMTIAVGDNVLAVQRFTVTQAEKDKPLGDGIRRGIHETLK